MKKKILLSALLTIVLCMSLITGATFALFTDQAEVSVAVTSGTVDVDAKITGLKTYSFDVEQAAGTFENGGTATLTDEDKVLKLDLMSPGDKATLTVDVTNNSNINVKYRVVMAMTGELAPALSGAATMGGKEYDMHNGMSTWVSVPAGEAIGDVTVSIEFPDSADNNDYMGKSAAITVSIEAVQGNGEVYDLPTGVTKESFGTNVAYVNGQYYATFQGALEALHANAEAGIATVAVDTPANVLYLKPGAEIANTAAHLHVCSSLTIYGNGAYFNSGDIELDTYKFCHSGAKACAGITSDLTLTVYNVGNVAVWGQRSTEHTININLFDCEDVNRVYISSNENTVFVDSTTNVVVDNCTYVGGTDYCNTGVYTNNPGTLKISNTEFTGYAIPVNQNNKSNGTQNIYITNCTFTDCATATVAAATNSTDYAAPVRVVATRQASAVSNLYLKDCEFVYTTAEKAIDCDVLTLDKRAGKPNNGKVNVYYGDEQTAVEVDAVVSDTVALKDAIATGDTTVYLTAGDYEFPVSGSGGYKSSFPSVAAGSTIIGEEGTVVNAQLNNKLDGVTFKNITFEAASTQYGFDSKVVGDVVFENCTFKATSLYAIHYDSGTAGSTLTYNNCTFYGFCAIGGSVGHTYFNNCKFYGNGRYATARTYGVATYDGCTFDMSNTNTTDGFNDGIEAVGSGVVVRNCINVNGTMEEICFGEPVTIE